MENAYYVTHPRIDKTAVVYAPATEKARTTFLDWLERNGLIKRSQRHLFRQDMIAEGIEDPNVPSDVVLNYGYEDFSGRFEFERPEVHDIPARLEEPEVEDILKGEYREVSPEEGRDIPEGDWRELKEEEGDLRQEKQREDLKAMRESSRMPIQQVMLRGYGK